VAETDGTIATGCTKLNYSRKHAEVFVMSRDAVIQQFSHVSNVDNNDLIIEAIVNSKKFK
jgi:hypothetical protein